MPQPTTEQAAIISRAVSSQANILVNAYAGCGKTSTIEMVERAVTERPLLYLCFNKKIAEEATRRVATTTTTVRTFNSLGHRIWAKAVGKNLTLDPKKSISLLRALIDETPKRSQSPLWDSFWPVVHGVALAKSLGYVPEGKFTNAQRLISQGAFHAALEEQPDDLTADLIDIILARSITAAYNGNIDYNDQIYMPGCFGGTFPRFPLIFVDEAQDLNPVNHALLTKLVKGRVVVVGDRFQSIYGFRGAVQGGMEVLAATHHTEPLELSVSFRCPQAIVENARWRVPNYQWMKGGGHVEVLDQLNGNDLPDSGTILCRNNAPLFRLAFLLLSSGRSVSVAGSDIGPKLIAQMRKLGPESLSQPSVVSAIDDWLSEKLARGSTTAQDLADCMKVFASHGADLGQAIRYAEHLFAQRGAIRLLTGHKAKGLEFPSVYFLDPWLCREDEQDLNLRYVIETRAMESLYYIDSRSIRW